MPSRLVRPVVGGLMLGAMALYTPQVLGAGHGALGLDFYWPLTAQELIVLILLKLFASLVSLASGFRGGLFFASLFVGSLLGKLYAIGVDVALSRRSGSTRSPACSSAWARSAPPSSAGP